MIKLTNRINEKDLAHKFSTERGGSFYGYEEAIRDCLDIVTPKVAIDFAEWIKENYATNVRMESYSLNGNTYRLLDSDKLATSKELFAIFLEQYDFESK